jgi:hypothetical protein
VKNLCQKLDKIIATAKQVALMNAKKDASTKKRNLTLPNANCAQDHIPFVPAKVELEPCPACNNMMTMAIDSKEEIDAINARNQEEYQKVLAEWETRPAKERGKKPRAKPTVPQTLACYTH